MHVQYSTVRAFTVRCPPPPPRGEDEDDIAEEDIDFGMCEDDPRDNELHEAWARVDPVLVESRRLRQRITQSFSSGRNNV